MFLSKIIWQGNVKKSMHMNLLCTHKQILKIKTTYRRTCWNIDYNKAKVYVVWKCLGLIYLTVVVWSPNKYLCLCVFLMWLDKTNKESVSAIQSSILTLCLDGALPAVPDEMYHSTRILQMMHGGGSQWNSGNRWFDKGLQVIRHIYKVCIYKLTLTLSKTLVCFPASSTVLEECGCYKMYIIDYRSIQAWQPFSALKRKQFLKWIVWLKGNCSDFSTSVMA